MWNLWVYPDLCQSLSRTSLFSINRLEWECVTFHNTCPRFHNQSLLYDFWDSQTSSSMLELGHCHSQPWILFTVSLASCSPLTLPPCAHHSCIFAFIVFLPTHVYPDLTPISPPLLFHVIDYSTLSWLPMKLSVPNFWKPSSLQRSISYLTSTSSLSGLCSVLDYFQLPDHFWHFWDPQSPRNAPEILGQEYKVGTAHKLKPSLNSSWFPAE